MDSHSNATTEALSSKGILAKVLYYRMHFCTHHQGLVIPSLLPHEVSYLRPRRILKDAQQTLEHLKTGDTTNLSEGLIDCSFSTRVLFSNVDMQDYSVSQHLSPTHMVILESGPCAPPHINLDPS